MEYEKMYKESLERAKKLKETCDSTAVVGWCEYIFPELKGSEDEKIRKYVKRAISVAIDYSYFDKETANNCLAWLEKQGEHKSINYADEEIVEAVKDISVLDMAEQKFNVGDTIIKKHNSDINDFGQFTITDITGGKYWYNDRIICDITEQDEWEFYKPVRQEPAWSEEDELMLNDILTRAECHSYLDAGNIFWLESLKDRMKGE